MTGPGVPPDDDRELASDLVAASPTLREIARVARVIPADAYPIESWDALDAASGGKLLVEFEGRRHGVTTLRALIPPFYFPIASRKDLMGKATDIHVEVQRLRHARAGQRLTKRPADATDLPDTGGEKP